MNHNGSRTGREERGGMLMDVLENARPPRGAWELLVDPAACPGWISGAVRLPAPGERVHTTEGTAVVMRILGRTGAGGRLLELSMDDGRKRPFFASAANVMVHPRDGSVQGY